MEIARQVLAVVFVLTLLGTALWALRRGAGPLQAARRGKDKTKSLQIIERVALTPQRSLAIDPGFHQLGLPVFVDAPSLTHISGKPFRQLMVGQDVGSAIRGCGKVARPGPPSNCSSSPSAVRATAWRRYLQKGPRPSCPSGAGPLGRC